MRAPSPSGCFDSSTPVWVLRVAAEPRIASDSPSPVQRFRDGMRLSASGFLGQARRVVVSARFGLGLSGTTLGTADPEITSLVDSVKRKLDGCSRVVALVGTPGPASKMTVVMLDSRGYALAYLKIGDSDIARCLIRNEVTVLEAVGSRVAVELLGSGDTQNTSWLLTGALNGTSVPGRARIPTHVLLGRSCLLSTRISDHPVVNTVSTEYEESLATAVRLLDTRLYSVAPTHGDAAPWNAVTLRDGSVRLFDWEYGSLAGLPESDAAHWSLQTSHLVRKLNPERAAVRAVSDLVTSAGLDRNQAMGIGLLTAIMLTSRLDDEGNGSSAQWWLRAAGAFSSMAAGRSR